MLYLSLPLCFRSPSPNCNLTYLAFWKARNSHSSELKLSYSLFGHFWRSYLCQNQMSTCHAFPINHEILKGIRCIICSSCKCTVTALPSELYSHSSRAGTFHDTSLIAPEVIFETVVPYRIVVKIPSIKS